jgi:hypothetical protein
MNFSIRLRGLDLDITGNGKNIGNGEIQGSLHCPFDCAQRFGRDDVVRVRDDLVRVPDKVLSRL